MPRETLKSRLGFILLSAGCAIGVGNVWRFPYMVGLYGGGAFVLLYLIFLIAMGVPVLTMEFSVGRASRKSPIMMYQEIEPKKSKWHIHGKLSMVGNYILMMFYTTVAGWMLYYFFKTAKGDFAGLNPGEVRDAFASLKTNMWAQILCMVIVVVIGFAVCSFSLQKGVERITKVMMIALLAIMVVLAINSIFLDGGLQGLKFYLIPDFGRMKSAGILNVIAGAMNQAFFTLSLGIGSMAIFGSYIGKDRALLGESINVAFLDTFVAFVSGLIIFPACFAYNGGETGAGPSLIFETLPNIFNHMRGGRIVGAFFFVFMSFAALSTVFAVFENIIACTMDLFHCKRTTACLANCGLMILLSLPCILGFNVWSGVHPLGADKNIMDVEDFLVSNILLPVGALVFVLFCTTRYGWGWKNFTEEANTGKGLKIRKWMRPYMTVVLPFMMLAIFILGLVQFFK